MEDRFRHRRDLVAVLLAKELKLRYQHTLLGYAWSVLHPLALAVIFFVVVRKVMRVPVADYPVFLICGLFPWQWFQNSLLASNLFFLGNGTLIKKLRFPKAALVFAGVLNDAVHFAASVPVIVALMLWFGKTPSPAWAVQIPLLLAAQFGLIYGLALLVATSNLFFRDLERLTAILTMLWFYVTPVLFPVSMIPERLMWIAYANPLAALVECWRRVFLDGVLPPDLFAAAAAYALGAWALGTWVYRRLEWRFAEVV